MKTLFTTILLLLTACSNQQTVYMQYYPQYDSYGINQDTIDNIVKNGKIPNIKIKGIKEDKHAPTIGFLLTKEPDLYTISASSLHSIIDAGGNVKLMDYTNNIQQMQGIDGLYLPGGYFKSPKEYYINAMPKNYKTDKRGKAYIASIKEAQKKGLPILGICAGAQMLGGYNGLKMLNKIENHHQKADILVHQTIINNNAPNVFENKELITNSMHNEAIDINSFNGSNLQLYAISDDGIPEAWGNEEQNLLGVQWHPETMYYKLKDKESLNIFKWLINKAKDKK